MSFLLLLCAALAAETGPSVPGRQIVGLLELPRVFGTVVPGAAPGTTRPAAGGPVLARATRDRGAPVVARLAGKEDFISSEHAYELRAAVVVGTDKGWYEVALSSGSGWVAAGDAGVFHPIEELLGQNLSFMTDAWDGRLYEKPDGTAREVPPHLRQARIKGSSRRVGRLWLEVETRRFSSCEDQNPQPPGETGWVPAHRADGVPNAWFYSRGC